MTRERSVSKHHIGKVTLWREEWDVYNDGSFLSDFRGWWPVEREISLTLIRKLPGFSIGLLHVEVLKWNEDVIYFSFDKPFDLSFGLVGFEVYLSPECISFYLPDWLSVDTHFDIFLKRAE